MRRLLLPLISLALTGSPVRAQIGTPAPAGAPVPLDRIDAMIGDGRYDEARTALGAWDGGKPDAADGRAIAMLRARLERDGVTAEHAYLAVALAYPFAPEAAEALLRVGEAALIQGDTAGARTYLRRFTDDFPAHSRRAEGMLWLSRTRSAAGDAAGACATAREALAAGAPADVQPLLGRQADRTCGTVAAAPSPGRPPAAAPSGAATPGAPASGRFAVQAGAFRGLDGARALVTRLRSAGFDDVRLVRVPANDLYRVRAGHFADASAAASARDRIRAAGFDAVVVGDAESETTPR